MNETSRLNQLLVNELRGIADMTQLVLDLLAREREYAKTHSERNAYSHVLRVELQALQSRARTSAIRFSQGEQDELPF